MKRIACLLACCCIFFLGSLTAFAKESAVRVPEDQIAITQMQSNFEAVIEIEPENAYAGAEIAVACPEGVTVTASSGSSGSMSAGPTLASGLYWTSFFESDNKLSGTMKITLQFSCTESFKSGNIKLQTVKVLTKNGAVVDTEELSPALEISVTRNGLGVTGSDSAANTPSDDYTNPDPNATSAEGGSGTGGEENPQTADDSNMLLWTALLFAGAFVIVGTTVYPKKRAK